MSFAFAWMRCNDPTVTFHASRMAAARSGEKLPSVSIHAQVACGSKAMWRRTTWSERSWSSA
jgi:hypothetical protein